MKKNEWNRFLGCKTGFLLVDASMKELLTTGFINNRARLILCTFWTKYLLINPFDKKYGSQVWFSKLLVDCSSALNKLNNQWILGDVDISGRRFAMKGAHPLTGRMIRIDNDMIKRYDPEFKYIKRWIPEYQELDIRECRKNMKQTKSIFHWKDRYIIYTKLFTSIPK